MKKPYYLIITLVILALIVAGIYSQSNQTAAYKIGASLPMSGLFALLGTAEYRGLEMAVAEINAGGGINGHPLELIVEDNVGETKPAVSGVQKLIDLDDVDLIFTSATHITSAIKDLAYKNDKLLLYHATVRTFAEESPLGFRDHLDSLDAGRAMGEHLVAKKFNRLAYLGANSDVCNSWHGEISKVLQENGQSFYKEEFYNGQDRDVRTMLLKLNLDQVDGLVNCTWSFTELFMKQLSELGYLYVPTYQYLALFLPGANQDEVQELFTKNNTTSNWYGFVQGQLNEKQKTFDNKYTAKYGEGQQLPDAGYAYDDVYIFAQAFDECEDEGKFKDNQCIIEKVTNSTYEGVVGQASFNAAGVSTRESILIQNINGQWQTIK